MAPRRDGKAHEFWRANAPHYAAYVTRIQMTGEPVSSRFCLVTAVLPAYRERFVRRLVQTLPSELAIISGREHCDATVRTGIPAQLFMQTETVFILGRRLFWQRGALRQAIGADVTVVDLNPRSLTAWATLVARRLLRRPVLVWGHIWPRRGAGARTTKIRDFMRRRADAVITYTQSDALAVRQSGQPAHVGANALYTREELLTIERPSVAAWDIIYVGRLVAEKRLDLLLTAFASCAPRLPEGASLLLVGDGPIRSSLQCRADELGIRSRVQFVDGTHDFHSLNSHYGRAICAVSPGYVGLSLTQSLGFGVPMVLPDNEPHAPEIELSGSDNTVVFRAGDADDLARALLSIYEDREYWRSQWDQCRSSVLGNYSVDEMVTGFVSALELARSGGGAT